MHVYNSKLPYFTFYANMPLYPSLTIYCTRRVQNRFIAVLVATSFNAKIELVAEFYAQISWVVNLANVSNNCSFCIVCFYFSISNSFHIKISNFGHILGQKKLIKKKNIYTQTKVKQQQTCFKHKKKCFVPKYWKFKFYYLHLTSFE